MGQCRGGCGGKRHNMDQGGLGNAEEDREKIPGEKFAFYQWGGSVEWLLFFHSEIFFLIGHTQSWVNQNSVNFNTNTVLWMQYFY